MPDVVTCIIEHQGKILLLKRSEEVGTYKELWGGVAGFIEPGEEPVEAALKEIHEEIGIPASELTLIKKFDQVQFTDLYEEKFYDWIVHPFLFTIDNKEKIRLDWEHTDYCWIPPAEVQEFDTVPRFKEIVEKVCCVV